MKKICARFEKDAVDPEARRQTTKTKQASTQSDQPIAASSAFCRQLAPLVSSLRQRMMACADATSTRLSAKASGMSDQSPTPVHSEMSAAAVQPARPDEKAT